MCKKQEEKKFYFKLLLFPLHWKMKASQYPPIKPRIKVHYKIQLDPNLQSFSTFNFCQYI